MGEEKINQLRREQGWTEEREGIVPIRSWIKEYFNKKENSSEFMRKNNGTSLEFMSKSEQRGYVFVGELQLDRNHEKRMLEERRIYEKGLNRNIIRVFVDNSQGLSGFYWEGKK